MEPTGRSADPRSLPYLILPFIFRTLSHFAAFTRQKEAESDRRVVSRSGGDMTRVQWYRRGVALAVLTGAAVSLQAQTPAVTPVTGSGTQGRIARFEGEKKVGDSSIVENGDGKVHIGDPVNGVGTGELTGKFARFQGVDGGVIGWEQRTNAPGNLVGVGGLLDNEVGSGVFGLARSQTGNAVGVRGRTNSPNGTGVVGVAALFPADGASFAEGNGVGVVGLSNVAGGSGIIGRAQSTFGGGIGVQGTNESPGGMGVYGAVHATTPLVAAKGSQGWC
jgi:hypothetical protein